MLQIRPGQPLSLTATWGHLPRERGSLAAANGSVFAHDTPLTLRHSARTLALVS